MDDPEFEKVFWMIQPQLMRYALTQLDTAGAEDAVSGTFLTLWRKQLRFPSSEVEERQLWALAYEVLNGYVRNEYRARRRRFALTGRISRLDSQSELVPDVGAAIAHQGEVEYWIGQLSVDDQRVVLLFNAGFDTDELAQILGCTPAAAAKRRTRARNRLREIVSKERGTA